MNENMANLRVEAERYIGDNRRLSDEKELLVVEVGTLQREKATLDTNLPSLKHSLWTENAIDCWMRWRDCVLRKSV
jgi:ABC-type phosphate transport system auxiliary subunit